MRPPDVELIDDYLRALGGRLRGPVGPRADLLAEARDSLRDAVDAYAEAGLDRRAAQLRAVAEFGAPDQLVPAYQAELTAVQGRRYALFVMLVPIAMLTADLMWWKQPGDQRTPPTGFLLMVHALDWASYALGGLALLALVLLGPATRWRRFAGWAARPGTVVRPLAMAGVGACVLIWSVGAFAGVNSVLESPGALRWPPMIIAWAMLNTTFGLLTRSGIRLLATTRIRTAAT